MPWPPPVRSGAGRRASPTGAPPSNATTSTSSTSSPPATRTPRSPSPPSRPASTCCARSPSPTPSKRRRRWRMPPSAPLARGVYAMVGFTYRRVPAATFARDLVASGKLGTINQVRASYRQDWLVDPSDPARLAPAEGPRRIRRAGRHRRPRDRPRPVHHRHAAHERVRHDRHDHPRAPPAREHLGPRRQGRHRDRHRHRRRRRHVHGPLRLGRARAASRPPASRPAARTRCASRCPDPTARSPSTSRTSTPCRSTTAPRPDTLQGFTKVFVTEPQHPYISAWWPAGHMLGYEHGFSHQAKDFVEDIAAGAQPPTVVRRRPAGAARARLPSSRARATPAPGPPIP